VTEPEMHPSLKILQEMNNSD